MKQKQLISLAVAGVAGLGAVLVLVTRKPKTDVDVQQVEIRSTKVLVASKEISLGEITTGSSLRWQEWPEGALGQGYIVEGRGKQLRDFEKRIARVPLLAGEPVTEVKLIKAGEGGVMSAILPAGMRAISTKIREETAAGKLILPNDFVDVILIQRKRSTRGVEEFVSDTMFRNVRVLAVGQTIETKEGKRVAEGQTATLELTPRQSELLALANSMGEISLALRSIADANPAIGVGAGKTKEVGNSIRVMRYGAKSRAYGVGGN